MAPKWEDSRSSERTLQTDRAFYVCCRATDQHTLPWLQSLAQAVEPLWVGGLAVLQIMLASRCLPLEGEAYEWAQFLLLATLYPLLIVVISRLLPLFPFGATWTKVAKACLAIACPLVAAYYLLADAAWLILLFWTAQLALQTASYYLTRLDKQSAFRQIRASEALGLGLVAGMSWVIAVRTIWWKTVSEWAANPCTLGALGVSLVLVVLNLFPPWPPSKIGRPVLHRFNTAFGLLLLGLASFRAGPCDELFYHHWGFIVGPADLVRQGGWLLWDVPAQYGFLSTIAVASVPMDDTWQSLYIVNAVLTFLCASFLFCLLRSYGQGIVRLCFSLVVTLAAIFLLPGWAPALSGPFGCPSVGPFRFCWCYALLAILVWETRLAPTGETHRRCLLLGCLVWLLGTLWASESAGVLRRYLAAGICPVGLATNVSHRCIRWRPSRKALEGRSMAHSPANPIV